MTLPPLRIGIIDSGVNPAHPHVGEHRIAAGAGIGLYRVEEGAHLDYLGHGTAVAGAICSHCPPDAVLLIAKVFDRTLNTRAETILRAIEWCAAQRADIVNLSLGTHNPKHADAFAEWARKFPIVSAAGSLPGGLPGVITVESDAAMARGAWVSDSKLLHFRASPHPRPIPGRSETDNLGGVSFAVANFTGLASAHRACERKWPWEK